MLRLATSMSRPSLCCRSSASHGSIAPRICRAVPAAPGRAIAPSKATELRGRLLTTRAAAGASSSGSPDLKINIEGMMCDGCSSRIENVLKANELVKAASVNLEGKYATVTLAQAAPDAAAKLVDTINGLGFEAKLAK